MGVGAEVVGQVDSAGVRLSSDICQRIQTMTSEGKLQS